MEAAYDGEYLERENITHIVTMARGIDPKYLHRYRYLCVDILDMPSENILQHLDITYEFIRDAITQGGNVLVHCHMGISRSATVVIAYLMKTMGIPMEMAYEMVRDKRNIVYPNKGFLKQLEKYDEMGCSVSSKSATYRRFNVAREAEKRSAPTRGDSNGGGHINIPISIKGGQTRPSPTGGHNATQTGYRCKTCRTVLFTTEVVIPHQPGENAGQTRFPGKHGGLQKGNQCVVIPISETHNASYSERRYLEVRNDTGSAGGHNPSGAQCTSYFIEPLKWIRGVMDGEHQGRIDCHKCGTKLGSYDWSGSACSCTRWVTPAFMSSSVLFDMGNPTVISSDSPTDGFGVSP
ncbi:tyrosine protein phosphatase yvh1 [Dispira parvispora]|uniref:protein-tyrosine-phosphatase n=1 Tax=Dispira parvispora TaxID=1520584 RepID=A0A9W8EAA7_9FUNG|nr:tyrosine protein phosphatase yvh1 [Dispira parvispora]